MDMKDNGQVEHKIIPSDPKKIPLPLISKSHKTIKEDFLYFKRYVMGAGTFGKVYYGITADRLTELAIKFENHTVKHSILLEEMKIYKELEGGQGIPKIYWYGDFNNYKVMVMDLLGPSLDKFFKNSENKRLSLETSINFAQEMVNRLEYVHSKNYIHRDIKPNNFQLGRFSSHNYFQNLNYFDNTVYIIDFGLSTRYIDPETNQHCEYKEGRRFVGTPRYASINAHTGVRLSRRDDLEAVAYCLVWYITGYLPWISVKGKTKQERKERIKQAKLAVTSKDICKNCPKQVEVFLDYTKNLKYEEKPDYEYIRNLLNSIKMDNHFTLKLNNVKWHWNVGFLEAKKYKAEKKNREKYLELKKHYESLFHGYPLCEFSEYLDIIENTHNTYKNNEEDYSTSNIYLTQISKLMKGEIDKIAIEQ